MKEANPHARREVATLERVSAGINGSGRVSDSITHDVSDSINVASKRVDSLVSQITSSELLIVGTLVGETRHLKISFLSQTVLFTRV